MTGFANLQSIKVANTYFQNYSTVVNVNFNGVTYTNNDGETRQHCVEPEHIKERIINSAKDILFLYDKLWHIGVVILMR